MKRTIYVSLFFILGLIIFVGCSGKKEAMGNLDKIYVFADSSDWSYYEDALNSVFGKKTNMPVAEQEYLLIWKPFDDFKAYEGLKNIFFLGRLDAKLPVSQNVRSLLNPDIIAGVESGKYFFIPKKDAFAYKQYVMFLVAKSRDDMIQKIMDLGDLMYDDFRKSYFSRLRESMFKHGEQFKIEKYLSDHFPFQMRVQHDYFVATEDLKENYVWIRRLNPDRSIFVHWLDLPENFELTQDWIIQTRNKMGKKIYSGDHVVENETKSFPAKFLNYNAMRTEGTWANDSVMVGGPFRSFTFVEPKFRRIYMVDFYVQAVGQRKRPYLDQLDVIIHSMKPIAQPKGDNKNEQE